ncbi:MAG: hypothetical protein EOO04_07055 [Chitinophagaceae bacterium]|nr:MAG: hypothetical protein EOO04_07055 [Chitinophagaceae bacterium]
MMRTILILVFVCECISGYAQKKPLTYRSQNFVGLLEGDNHKGAFQLQTIHGVQLHHWFAGLGAGLDYYLQRSVPLFFAVNRDVQFKNRTFFIGGDLGTNLPWVKDEISGWWSQSTNLSYHEGLYWGGHLGYKAYFKNQRDAIVLSLGYSYKHLKADQVVTTFCQQPPCLVNTERFDYRLNRVSMKIGWQF